MRACGPQRTRPQKQASEPLSESRCGREWFHAEGSAPLAHIPSLARPSLHRQSLMRRGLRRRPRIPPVRANRDRRRVPSQACLDTSAGAEVAFHGASVRPCRDLGST